MKNLLAVLSLAAVMAVPAAFAQTDGQLKTEVQKALSNSKFKDVQVTVQQKIATLSGTVNLYDVKHQAEQRANRVKGIDAVRDSITVAGTNLSDSQLQEKLVGAISYDRVGYGTTPFNSISVEVQNGIVRLAGFAYGPVDADSAAAIAANTAGVRDVVNDIEVNPVSPMDDGIRIRVFRAIYGSTSLTKYAIDPAKPIRIQVQNGNVALYGVVDSQADRDVAGIRANGVAGVFSVTNHLQVTDAPTGL
ncbi:MAG TPA: BON domain-containing protein [Terracidiphilus sp.]|jgi:osmotically-inducible protein OsmY